MFVSLVAIGSVLATARVREFWASRLYGYAPTLESLQRAGRIDPGNYAIQYLTAALLVQRNDCSGAADHIRAARRLVPFSSALDALEARCTSEFSVESGEEASTPDGAAGGATSRGAPHDLEPPEWSHPLASDRSEWFR